MKWIGQHIWDFISRFRSDVYLEATETGTIASGGNLGLDANNKIVKADTETGELSFDGSTANGVLTYKDADEISVESTLTYDGSVFNADCANFTIENSTTGTLTVQNTAANATGGTLNLKNTNNGVDANNSDYCGYVKFWGQDDGTPSLTEYGNIDTQITDVANGNEAGTMRLRVLNNTGTGALLDGIAIYGNTDTDGEIDVDIASGTSSVTTIAGDLDIDGDTITSAGVLKIIPADVSGLALHIDADADTDNEIRIDAGILDINVTTIARIDVATSLAITGKTLITNRTLTVTAGSSAGEFDGDVVYTGTTTGMTTGALYVYANTGQWVLANAAAVGTTKGLLAIALGDESDVDGMLLRGMVTTNGVSGTQDEGAELYMRASTGTVTTVAPTGSGQCVRIVGYCMENSNSRIYFNPDNTYIEIA
jgi:hypothetical protein